ncbi:MULTISPECIES: hypothetical protein [Candidatus Accumulibacter]|uniref:hypothetical protein n=1 Tax=Candidatus Accumulibacter TaxID=327159 RepID=UPI00145CB567|nr:MULTISPECIES: hypothetical protein [Candidatus Accumulibacter]
MRSPKRTFSGDIGHIDRRDEADLHRVRAVRLRGELDRIHDPGIAGRRGGLRRHANLEHTEGGGLARRDPHCSARGAAAGSSSRACWSGSAAATRRNRDPRHAAMERFSIDRRSQWSVGESCICSSLAFRS